MNANELMIGDWVQYDVNAWRDDEYDRKCCVPDYQPFKIESGEELDKLILDDGKPKPIPLTSEILKKNGWNRYGALCSGNGCTITVWSEDLFYFSCSKKHNDAPSELISCHIHYVHELQHALRLAGINKEIVL